MELKTLKSIKTRKYDTCMLHTCIPNTKNQNWNKILNVPKKTFIIIFLRNKKEKRKTPETRSKKHKRRRVEERYKSLDRIKYSSRKVGFCGREFGRKKEN